MCILCHKMLPPSFVCFFACMFSSLQCGENKRKRKEIGKKGLYFLKKKRRRKTFSHYNKEQLKQPLLHIQALMMKL